MSNSNGIWCGYSIPIIFIAGEPSSGKTLFILGCVPPGKDTSYKTLIWDTEGSSLSYQDGYNFDRIDLPKELLNAGKSNYSTTDMFLLFRKQAIDLSPRQYTVLGIDTITEIEDGLADYVRSHPTEFNYTSGQFVKMPALVWGVVKREWKRLLMILAQKCETVVLTAHMKQEFSGSQPTNKRIPRSKDTVTDVSSLSLILSRQNKVGEAAAVTYPSAICTKSRLISLQTKVPLIPPRLPCATPDGIRRYLLQPPDIDNLKPEERAEPERTFTDDDRLVMQAEIARARAEAAQASLSQAEIEREISKEKPKPTAPSQEDEELKSLVLAKMSAASAKQMLLSRYQAQTIRELTAEQRMNFREHLQSLGN